MAENKNGWHNIPLETSVPYITNQLMYAKTSAWVKKNLHLLFSENEPHDDSYWKHASISLNHRYPTWDEILDVRYTFFDNNEQVFQILPPKSEYVNVHKNCFHLWSKVGENLLPHC